MDSTRDSPGIFIDSTSPEAARIVAHLLEEHRNFSFLRLGDGELRFLLQMQGGEEEFVRTDLRPSCEIAHGHPALTPKDYERLLRSYERCTLLDVHGELPYNREHLPQLRWERAAQSVATASSGRLGLLFTWVHHELRAFLARHRTVICGAESALLRELLRDPIFQRSVSPWIPANAALAFVEPRHGGRSVSTDLEAIKTDLANAVREHRADTILVSLGGAAKILCYELAEELGVRAIDFGSALRGLTYSGSDGQSLWRASHHPYLVRVPLDRYVPALQRAHPKLDPVMLTAKVHAQLCLEMQRKDLLQSNTSDINDAAMFDPSPENLRHFSNGMDYYRARVVPQVRQDPEALELIREFRLWRRKRGLGWDGKLFQVGVKMKAALRKAISGNPA